VGDVFVRKLLSVTGREWPRDVAELADYLDLTASQARKYLDWHRQKIFIA
jgi:hypothetical protein